MTEKIVWYSTTLKLRHQTHEAVGFSEAIVIVRRYFANFQPFYEWGEEALSATLFGFTRASDQFIEICVHGPDEASVRIELPGRKLPWYLLFLWPWLNVYQHDEEGVSREAVEERVRQFYDFTAEVLRARLKRGD